MTFDNQLYDVTNARFMLIANDGYELQTVFFEHLIDAHNALVKAKASVNEYVDVWLTAVLERYLPEQS